jgi:hypothetical protein
MPSAKPSPPAARKRASPQHTSTGSRGLSERRPMETV